MDSSPLLMAVSPDQFMHDYLDAVKAFTAQLKTEAAPALPAHASAQKDSPSFTARINEFMTVLGRFCHQYNRMLRMALLPEAKNESSVAALWQTLLTEQLPHFLIITTDFTQALDAQSVHRVCYKALLTATVALLCTLQGLLEPISRSPAPKQTRSPVLTEVARPRHPKFLAAIKTHRLLEHTYQCVYHLLRLGCRAMPTAISSFRPSQPRNSPAPFLLQLSASATMEIFFLLVHQTLAALSELPEISPQERDLASSVLLQIVEHVFAERPELLINFLPGVLSCLSKQLVRPTTVTGPSQYTARLIAIASATVVGSLNDADNRAWTTPVTMSWADLGHAPQVLSAHPNATEPFNASLKAAAAPSTGQDSSSPRLHLTQKSTEWWRQAMPNVTRCLEIIVGLHRHSHWRVRLAVTQLCSLLLRECMLTLRDAVGLLVETVIGLTDDAYDTVRHACQDTLAVLAHRVCTDVSVRQLVRDEMALAVQSVNPLALELEVAESLGSAMDDSSTGPGQTMESITRSMKLVTGYTVLLQISEHPGVTHALPNWLEKVVRAVPLDDKLRFTTPSTSTVVPLGLVSTHPTTNKETTLAMDSLGSTITTPSAMWKQYGAAAAQALDSVLLQGSHTATAFVTALRDYLVQWTTLDAAALQRAVHHLLLTKAIESPDTNQELVHNVKLIYLIAQYLTVQCQHHAIAKTSTPDLTAAREVYGLLIQLTQSLHQLLSSVMGDANTGSVSEMPQLSPVDAIATPTGPQNAQQDRLRAALDSLVFYCQAHIAVLLQRHFRPQLQTTMFPMLQGLTSDQAIVREQATRSLVMTTVACGYPSVATLVTENMDYLMDSFSVRLQLGPPQPGWLAVLGQSIRIAGPRIIPLVDDVLEDLLDLLTMWRDDATVARAAWRVIEAVSEVLDVHFAPASVKQITGSDSLTLPAPVVLPDTDRQLLAANTSPNDRQSHLVKSGLSQLLDAWNHSADEVDPLTDPTIPLPDDALSATSDESNADDLERLDDPQSLTTTNDAEKPLLPEQALGYKIALFTPNFLVTSDASIRATALACLTRTLTVTKGTPEHLALVHRVWSDAVSRLQDPDSVVLLTTARFLQVLSQLCGDFLRQRFRDDVWPLWQQYLADVLKHKVQPGLFPQLLSTDSLKATQVLLVTLRDMVRGIPLTVGTVVAMAIQVLPFLGHRLPEPVRLAAEQVLGELGTRYGDTVWTVLQQTRATMVWHSGTARRAHPNLLPTSPAPAQLHDATPHCSEIRRQRPVPGWSTALGSVEQARRRLLDSLT
ncbi:TEL2-interacting protein 1 [Dimargaris verticillata]|uniref:TEL2-interacting protein 1 n=1 Tax=Dimargaris verticillata TaxID=2761393 RepID=A0A9W8B717_9FUNG|nr:TEL2-interacting protein 1 [Dimargaris verticillata]